MFEHINSYRSKEPTTIGYPRYNLGIADYFSHYVQGPVHIGIDQSADRRLEQSPLYASPLVLLVFAYRLRCKRITFACITLLIQYEPYSRHLAFVFQQIYQSLIRYTNKRLVVSSSDVDGVFPSLIVTYNDVSYLIPDQ